jgi:prepilin-type N-terminal cleavage/methylation domain-containing protein/prepilin-type processing-associated H-X9-DG protein
MTHPNQARAFTLVEIIVVVALLALLAAMLFPAFASARAKAREASCVSNLRQIGMGISLYARDFDDFYPRGTDTAERLAATEPPNPPEAMSSLPLLRDVLQPYLPPRAVWHCPSDTGWKRAGSAYYDSNGALASLPQCDSAFERFGTSYNYRVNLGLQRVRYPAHAYSFAKPPNTPGEISSSEVGVMSDMTGNWHGGTDFGSESSILLFADGHVKRQLRISQLMAAWLLPLRVEDAATGGEGDSS